MRRLLILGLCFLAQPVCAEDLIVDEHKIIGATVYNDRATLTRIAEIEVPEGEHTLVLKGLPISLFPDSLRSKGSAKAKVTFGALSHKQSSFEDYVVPKEKELNEELRKFENMRKNFEAEKQALQVGRKFLENIGNHAVSRENEVISNLELNPDEWAGAADGLSKKISENLKMAIATDVQINEIDQKIQKIRQDMNQLRTGQKQAYDVTIPFVASAKTTLKLSLDYQIPQVGWTPIYDARLDTKTGRMELVQYGSVWQRTGEDWEDVSLTLSTARPNRGTGLPDLHPHWVSIRKKNSDMARLEKALASGASAIPVPVEPMYMAAVEEQNQEEDPLQRWRSIQEERVEFEMASIDTSGFVSEYKITGPATVKSDGSQSKLLVGSFKTENSIETQIKPQMSTDAYLVVKATLQGEASILPGQVNLFRDGAFIGKSRLPMLRPGDEEELSFGIDDNVVVERHLLKDESSEAGLITKETTISKNFVTKIKSLHKDPVSIAVFETVPVSKDERIRVSIVGDKTTKGYEKNLNDVKGLYRWGTDIKPGDEAKIYLGWQVTWPKGENISGL